MNAVQEEFARWLEEHPAARDPSVDASVRRGQRRYLRRLTLGSAGAVVVAALLTVGAVAAAPIRSHHARQQPTPTPTQSSGVTSGSSQPINPVVAALVVRPATGRAPLRVRADASASTPSTGASITGYRFDFGDGTRVLGPQAASTATHVYRSPGTYPITVEVKDSAGASMRRARQVTVAGAPLTAQLRVRPRAGPVPLTVRADASDSTPARRASITGYAFDFGDGTVLRPQRRAVARHTYKAAGAYTVRVTVTDTTGASATALRHVTVRAAPATTRLKVTPSSGSAPLQVKADASGSTPPTVAGATGYTFDFGDGTVLGPQADATAGHTYKSPGDYTVTVRVRDASGASRQASQDVTVT